MPRTTGRAMLGMMEPQGGFGRRRGMSLFEMLMGLALLVLLFTLIWSLWGTLTARSSRLNLVTGASRTMVQQQSRQAIRKLFYRLQEGIQILEPLPGGSANALVFRDILNNTIRLRLDRNKNMVITERLKDRTFELETPELSTSAFDKPIQVASCKAVTFTTITPTTVLVAFTTADSQIADSFMAIISLANGRLGS